MMLTMVDLSCQARSLDLHFDLYELHETRVGSIDADSCWLVSCYYETLFGYVIRYFWLNMGDIVNQVLSFGWAGCEFRETP